jgi:hypothetical protein
MFFINYIVGDLVDKIMRKIQIILEKLLVIREKKKYY